MLAENLDEEPFWIERGKVHADKFFFRIIIFVSKAQFHSTLKLKEVPAKDYSCVCSEIAGNKMFLCFLEHLHETYFK